MSEYDSESGGSTAAPEMPRITKNQATLGGAAKINGTRVRVSDIVIDRNYHDLSPEEIAEEYPSVSVSEVYAALSYFAEHTDEIRGEIRQREQEFNSGD